MSTNQELRQASVRTISGTALDYNSDWMTLFSSLGYSGTFNERLIQWINARLQASYTDISSAMSAFAANQGVDRWNDIGTFDAFDPVTDFLKGTDGFILDGRVPTNPYPSGIYPNYQDQTGTVASADTNPVGLAIEGSQKGALGADLINGFSGFLALSGCTIINGVASFSSVASGSNFTSGFNVVAGGTYKVTFTISNYGAGVIRPGLLAGGLGTFRSANGTYTQFLQATVSEHLVFNVSGTTTLNLVATCEIVSGNHFLQTTSGARPKLALVNGKWPYSGDGLNFGLFGSKVPGSGALSAVVFLAPVVGASGANLALGSADAGPTNRCQVGVNNGVICAGFGSDGVTTIVDPLAQDIRGSSAVASLNFDGTTITLDALFSGASAFRNLYSAPANGHGSTAAALAFLANNAAGSLASFANAQALAMFVGASRTSTERLAAAKYLRSQAGAA